jgi:hypothetical protein
MSTAEKTIDYVCSLWGGDRLDVLRKLEWVDNASFSTRAGLERQAKYLKPGSSLYALVENEKTHPNGVVMADVGKKAHNLVLQSFVIE